ncbi:hypothetical protein KHQ81_15360 (plasmid) [Mycoplasmatota bacterium]|nr:hypothetical protein KHQ81_15360 [Mycoplasmatota bacterium]
MGLENRRYTDEEYSNMRMFMIKKDNLQAVTEISDHQKFFGKDVEVYKGRKLPIGTRGIVISLKTQHFAQSVWRGWTTKVGIETDDNKILYTYLDNIRLV